MERRHSGSKVDLGGMGGSGNYPQTTRYNYLLAVAQLARYLNTVTEEAFVDAAADPTWSNERTSRTSRHG
jgi:hypothetical protein